MYVYVESSAPMRPDPVNPYSLDEISRRLRLLRKALGNTQATMGDLAGVSHKAWQNYEAGIRRIEIDAVFRLEAALNVPQEWIYSGVVSRLPLDLAQKIELAKRELQREKRTRG